MTSAVPVQCTCGHTSTVEPTALGRPRLCEACGHSFVAWPLDKDIQENAPPTWFVQVGSHELGPFHLAEIDRLVSEGRVTADTLVRRHAQDPWITALAAGLADEAAAPPPVATPLPVAAPLAEPLPVAAPVVEGGRRPASRRSRAPRETKKRTPLVAIGIAAAIVVVGLGAWAALQSGSSSDDGRVETAGDGTDEAGSGDTATTPDGPALDEQMARAAASVVRVKGRLGAATGFVVAPGILATSRKLLADERLEDVQLEAAQQAAGSPKLRYIDPELDLAFFELDDALAPISLATKVSLAPGTEVRVLGFSPTTAPAGATPNITRGACRSRVLLAGQPHNLIEVPAESPCSGCPVLDGEGGVIGMVTCVDAAESGQCVFIPLSSLKASLDHALALPDGERERIVALHRLGRLGRKLWTALRSYSDVGQTYLVAMQDAVAKGQDPAEGIEAVRKDAETRLETIDKDLPGDLAEQVESALGDPTLHNLTKRRMKRLQAAFDGLRAHLADPPTALQDYRRRQEHWAYEANTAGRELLEADGLRLEGE